MSTAHDRVHHPRPHARLLHHWLRDEDRFEQVDAPESIRQASDTYTSRLDVFRMQT